MFASLIYREALAILRYIDVAAYITHIHYQLMSYKPMLRLYHFDLSLSSLNFDHVLKEMRKLINQKSLDKLRMIFLCFFDFMFIWTFLPATVTVITDRLSICI